MTSNHCIIMSHCINESFVMMLHAFTWLWCCFAIKMKDTSMMNIKIKPSIIHFLARVKKKLQRTPLIPPSIFFFDLMIKYKAILMVSFETDPQRLSTSGCNSGLTCQCHRVWKRWTLLETRNSCSSFPPITCSKIRAPPLPRKSWHSQYRNSRSSWRKC